MKTVGLINRLSTDFIEILATSEEATFRKFCRKNAIGVGNERHIENEALTRN